MKPTSSQRILRLLAALCVLASIAAHLDCEAAQSGAAASPTAPVSIRVDLSRPVGRFTPIYAWFGYDEANYTTMPHGRELLGELHDLSPVPVYIRVHHLLTSGDGKAELKFSSTNVYREDASGKPIYDFTLLDGIFDTFKATGVRPLVELGFMPKDLAADLPDRHVPYQVHYPKSTVSGSSNNPPKDYKKWQELVKTVTSHLVERYGRSEVLSWYFEVWNEPDIDYWHGTPEDYWKLYDYSVAGVRSALPGAKVGGPASTSPGNEKANQYLRRFLEHVSADKSSADGRIIPIDFISFHAKGSPSIEKGVVTMGLNRELKDVDRGFDVVAQFPRLRHLPIILSEADPEGCAACSSKVNPANNYRNGTLYPAYTAAAFKALLDLKEKHRANLISMLSWSFEFEDKDYFEGFRSLATNGVDKPILNLFRMFGMMAGNRVQTTSSGEIQLEDLVQSGVRAGADVDSLATAGEHEASVLVWNYHDVNVPAPSSQIALLVRGIPVGVRSVLVEHFRIDDTHSNAYTVWQRMGSPQQPTPKQFEELRDAGQLQLLTSPKWVEVRDGKISEDFDLPRQSISLLHLHWE